MGSAGKILAAITPYCPHQQRSNKITLLSSLNVLSLKGIVHLHPFSQSARTCMASNFSLFSLELALLKKPEPNRQPNSHNHQEPETVLHFLNCIQAFINITCSYESSLGLFYCFVNTSPAFI